LTNYYQILGLENFSDARTVHARYIQLIKINHPDVNKDPDAAEFSKILNMLKEELTDPGKKDIYDQRLRWYLQNPTSIFSPPIKDSSKPKGKESKIPGWSDLTFEERKKIVAEFQRKKDIEDLALKLKNNPPFSRLSMSAILLLTGSYIYFKNYFITQNNYETILIVFGLGLFTAGVFHFVNFFYCHFKLKELQERKNVFVEKQTIVVFLALYAALLSIIPAINNQLKKQYLANDYEIVRARNYTEYYTYFHIEYTVNEKIYIRKMNEVAFNKDILGRKYVCVKYARKNPRMATTIILKGKESCIN
jgi:hypothetical protein